MKEWRFLQDPGPYARFDRENFAAPDPAMGPSFSWLWNDRLSREEIDRQLDGMREGGIRSVYVIPEPKNFRPGVMETYLEPDYLTPEYWTYFRYAMEQAKKRGMVLWLYDEGGWPSGSACGKIAREHPELTSMQILREDFRYTGTLPENTVALFRENTPVTEPVNGENYVRYFRQREKGGGWTPVYSNLLEQEAVDEFLSVTHEECKKVCGELFGDAMPFCFTDEPAIHQIGWARDTVTDFQAKKGYDIRAFLPALFDPDVLGEEGRRARIDWYDWWSDRFVETYLGSLRRWCGENRLLSIGHMGGDDRTAGSAVHGSGHILRCLRRFDVPGVDAIWRQIFPAPRLPHGEKESPYQNRNGSYANHYFPRYAASAAHQQGLRWALTETGAVYGSGFSFGQNAWVCLYQMVRGINLVNQMVVSFGNTGHLMTGEKPLYFPEMPGYRQLAAFNRMISRVSYVTSLGEPDTSVALYLPMRDLWAGGRTLTGAEALHDRVAYALERLQVGFDLFDDDILEEGMLQEGKLVYGGAAYGTLVVAACRYIDREKLKNCAAAGVRVLWVTDEGSAAPEGCEAADFAALGTVPRLVGTADEDLRVLRRKTAEGPLYMLYNEALERKDFDILLPEDSIPEEVDAVSGCIRPVEAEQTEMGVRVRPRLMSGEAMLLLFAPEQTDAAYRFRGEETVAGAENFTLRPQRSFVIGEDHYESRCTDAPAVPVLPGDWRPVLGEDFSGEAVYTCIFTLTKEQAAKSRWLDLGKVCYTCSAVLNGTELGDRFAAPYAYETEGLLREGENRLTVTVANTAANQFVGTKSFDRYTEGELGPYHAKTRPFEPESLESGLFGPVILTER